MKVGNIKLVMILHGLITDYDDSDWKSINPQLNKEDFEKLEWTGNIWFRNEIQVDSSLWNIVFGFNFYCTGAAEVYLNGKSTL